MPPTTSTANDRPLLLHPFSVGDALTACLGTVGTDSFHDRPLRVLERDDDGVYQIMPYQDQPYVAISYCWPGDPSFQRLGSSNEPTVVATPDRQMSSSHFSQFISKAAESYDPNLAVWIDFHCINQSDDAEKAAQVAIMQRIYTQAKLTLVMLEDIALSSEDRLLLGKPQATPVALALVRRILSARWFSRAWCSQELVLSHHAHIYVHDTTHPGKSFGFSSDTLWHCVDAARARDASLPLFTQPRGHLPDIAMAKSTCAWALSIVHRLGCSDEYDRVSLICNLVRFVHRFTSRPTAFGTHVPAISLNVLMMANVIALKRRDYSLLLTNHGTQNPLRGYHGFGWAGEPLDGDRASASWNEKDFQVAKDPKVTLDQVGLVAFGCLAHIVREHTWNVRYDPLDPVHLTIDGRTHAVDFRPRVDPSWNSNVDGKHLRDLVIALAGAVDSHICEEASYHARVVLAYLFAEDYAQQPDPVMGDLRAVVQPLLGNTLSLKDIASAMSFIWQAPNLAVFSTVLLSDGSVLLVSGNAGKLTGHLLFQPYIIRPKLFSPPVVLTANSMVLENSLLSNGARRCVGCVRGLGMITEDSRHGAQSVRVV
ncbi:heterokaryon incompatibility protein-domain-containing protein [Trametes meyenii]|nr:heterokaryon incompatibility protein-domain-containing protein [Trametes meyenii]